MDEARQEIQSTERAGEQERAARLFDIRRLIGGLFMLYGVMLFAAGLTASDADIRKAVGVNINLWLGIGMFCIGVLMLFWAWKSPVRLEHAGDER